MQILGYQLAPLWTDWLVYLLVAAGLGFYLYARRHEHLARPWRQVARRPLAVSAAMVLLVYIVIGLADSIHLQEQRDIANSDAIVFSSEKISVLDIVLTTLRVQEEKTYSAPFAIRSYAKETVELPEGGIVREFPRLVYGGTHLDFASERRADITAKTLRALIESMLIFVLVIVMLSYFLAKNNSHAFGRQFVLLKRGETDIPWRSLLLTGFIITVVSLILIRLSPYYHVLGTDKVGTDVLYLSLKSIRTGLVIGSLTTLFVLPFALSLGIMAGYFRGRVDDLIQYVYTTLSSIPGVLLIAASVLMIDVYIQNNADQFATIADRADARLLFLCLILGITGWVGLCRLLRGEALKLREIDYIQASQAFGVSHARILSRHILPNVMHIVLITLVLDFSGLVLAEAVLSYIGVGVDPSMISWGNMINGARLEMAREPVVWWSLVAAFIFMFLLVLCANLFSDAVRDAFDPRAC
ncbi:ABC transporter permease [Gammaproteobacteria bacterium AH-315-C21]|nr:ABC transporter permease [Gammaproteobacteria bacterium AH-315-C21]